MRKNDLVVCSVSAFVALGLSCSGRVASPADRAGSPAAAADAAAATRPGTDPGAAPGPAAVDASAVALRLSVANGGPLAEGDELALRLEVSNGAPAPIRVVRPVYGSWEGAREPRYSLEFVVDDGSLVPAALGWAPGLECGVMDPVQPQDVVTIPPGGTGELCNDDGFVF